MTIFGKKKYSPFIPLFGFLAGVVALWIILFSGTSEVTRSNIEQHLQQFADRIARDAAANGKEGKFSYGTVEIEGWGYNKHATIDNVSLEISEKALVDTLRWSLSTTKMLVEQNPAAIRGLFFVFPDPVNFIENSQLKTTITFSAPLKYGYLEGTQNHAPVVTHVLELPPRVTLTPPKAADAVAGHESPPIVIGYDPNPVFRVTVKPESQEREAAYEFHNISIAGGEGTEATVDSLVSHLNEKPGEGGRSQGKYTLALSDLAVHDHEKVSSPYSVNVDLDYTGDMPYIGPDKGASDTGVSKPGAGNVEVTLNNVSLVSSDFKIKAEGKIATTSDDPLPSGNITLDIDNVNRLLASDMFPEHGRSAVAAALQKITGQPVDALTHVAIPLKREKSGVFYVGNTTFEELAAMMLANMMQAHTPQPQVPAAPLAETPMQAPAQAASPPASAPAPVQLPAGVTPAVPASPPEIQAPPEQYPPSQDAPVPAPGVGNTTPPAGSTLPPADSGSAPAEPAKGSM